MQKQENRLKRKKRVRSKVNGTSERPRLSVFRSNKHIFAQIINDDKAETLVSVSDSELAKANKDTGKVAKMRLSFEVGELLAKKALARKIKRVVFDRNGYQYHGRVKEFADGARKGGLEL
jgi:large subunit ribosomal protein L18